MICSAGEYVGLGEEECCGPVRRYSVATLEVLACPCSRCLVDCSGPAASCRLAEDLEAGLVVDFLDDRADMQYRLYHLHLVGFAAVEQALEIFCLGMVAFVADPWNPYSGRLQMQASALNWIRVIRNVEGVSGLEKAGCESVVKAVCYAAAPDGGADDAVLAVPERTMDDWKQRLRKKGKGGTKEEIVADLDAHAAVDVETGGIPTLLKSRIPAGRSIDDRCSL